MTRVYGRTIEVIRTKNLQTLSTDNIFLVGFFINHAGLELVTRSYFTP